jgi:hypothetical protein
VPETPELSVTVMVRRHSASCSVAFEVSDTIRMFVRLVSLELVAISVPSVSSQRAVSVRVDCP